MERTGYFHFRHALGAFLVCSAFAFSPLLPVLPNTMLEFHLPGFISTGMVADYYPPYPYPKLFHQPDGSSFEGIIRGKDIGGGIETLDGYTIKRAVDGWWKYATDNVRPLSGDNRLIVGRSISLADIPKHIGQTESIWLDENGRDLRTALWESVRLRLGPTGAVGTKKYPVLMMSFSNRDFPPQDTPDHYQQLLFGTYPTGSAKEFFYENSYGKFNFTGDVFGPFEMSQTMEYYGAMDDAGKMAADILPLADSAVNFANYTNGGTSVDMVIIIHAGLDEAATGDPNDIWSNSDPSWKGTFDGVTVQAPNTCSEDTEIGTVTHETGHSLGEPDYYDTTYKSQGTGEWDTMAGGTWLGNPPSSNPAHFNPLSKINYGWLTPKIVSGTAPGEILLPSAVNPDVIRIPISGTNQAFLLEYKNTSAGLFDRYIYSNGLLIWHHNPGGSNSKLGNYMLDVEEFDYRDGTQELELNMNRAETTDPWADDAIGMGPATSPNTKTSGSGSIQSNFLFCNIGKSLSSIKFDIYKLSGMVDLSIDKPTPKTAQPIFLNNSITLATRVYNNGMNALSDVKVRLYDGNPSDCMQIGADILLPTVSGYSSTIVELPWTPESAGFRMITAVVDPDNTVLEACESNNIAASVYPMNLPGSVRVFERWASVLIVDDDSGLSSDAAFEDTLTALRYPYITVEKTADRTLMGKFDAVIWFTGQDRQKGALTPAEISEISAYLDSGGMIWFSSPRLGTALAATGILPGVDPIFFENYLGAKGVDVIQNSGFNITGTGDEIGGNDVYEILSTGKRPMTDTVKLGSSTVGVATSVFASSYGNLSATKVLGNSVHNQFRSIYTAFDLDQLTVPDRLTLVERVLDWFRLSTIDLDKSFYSLDTDTTVHIFVHDKDLNTDPLKIENGTVTIVSSSDVTGETVKITENGTDSSEFLGAINISTTKNPGKLRVAKGDRINATYIDTTTGKVRYALASIAQSEFATFQAELTIGWNLFSVPLALNETDAATILANMTSSYDRILYFDSADKDHSWKTFVANKSAELNPLLTIDRKMGLWIRMTKPAIIKFSGYMEDTNIPLRKGWNLIGYPTLNGSRTVSDVFIGLPVTMVQGFSEVGKYRLREMAFDEKMIPGLGYWVYTGIDCILRITP